MAKSGSGRPGGSSAKGGSAGRGKADGRNSSGSAGGRSGGGRGGKGGNKSSSAAAQRAIKGARGQSSLLRNTAIPAVIIIVIAAVVVVGIVLSRGNSSNASSVPQTQQDTSTALLAKTSSTLSGQTIDGISSNDMEQLVFHIHAHLAIYINGTQKLLPYGIGIVPPYQLQQIPAGQPAAGTPFVGGGSKFYWLHTHDETGVIHIESPKQETFTLGQFFDEWMQPLGPNQVGPNNGKVIAYVNGKPFTGNPRDIPLAAHNVIQLDIGKDVPPAPFTFPSGE
ncbi:MAG TPA: hypothetical protein VHX38_22410 [Pseudonocardiaceae bacterium]|jgi:hypothetical protein|nr:hypothetical protein [Pseudonocardiaceae bacterium]